MKLYELAIQHQQFHRQLEELQESDDLPPEVLRDTLESIEGEFNDKAVTIAKIIKNIEADAEAIHEAAKQMEARAYRAQAQADRIKAYLHWNMLQTGKKSITSPWFKITVRENPVAVDLADNWLDVLPKEYLRVPEPPPPAPDKKKIKEALTSGTDVPGARLTQSDRLEIKV